MKSADKRIIRVWVGGAIAAFLAVLSWAGERADGTYRITRDETNFGGAALEGGGFLLTGSMGGVETKLTAGASQKVMPGLPGIYFYPNSVINVDPSADAVDPNVLLVAWTAPAGELPAKVLGAYPPASSYIIKYSSMTPLTSQAAFEAASTAAAPPAPAVPGTAQNFSVPGLLANTSYYIAIESLDGASQVGRNASYFSNSTSAFTLSNTPNGLFFLAKTSNSVLLAWNPRNERVGLSVTYDAQRAFNSAFTSGVQTFQTVSASTVQATHDFTFLGAGADYYFRVRAYNGDGIPSPWSVSVTTQIEVGLPGILPFTGHTTSGVTANWDNGVNAIGQGIGYEMRLDDDGDANPDFVTYLTQPAPAGVDVFSTSFSGLQPNTTYFGLVRAVPPSPGLPGSFSGPAATMTNVHRGTAGTFTAHVTSATFTWNPPATSNGPNGFFYRVELSTEPAFTGTIDASTVPSSQLTTAVTGLTPNTVYYGRLVTLNGIMIPSAQGPSTFGPNATLPMIPAVTPAPPLGFTFVDDHQVELAWSHNGNNVAQSRYQVELTSDAAGNFAAFPPISAVTVRGTQTYRFNTPLQLLANTTYFARIMTLGDSGVNSAYALFGSTITRPTTPSNLAFTGMSTTTLTVNWSAVNAANLARNGPDTSYLVELDVPGAPTPDQSVTTTALSAPFSGLLINTTYFVSVTALRNGASWPNAAALTGARATLAATPGLPAGFSGVTDSTITVNWSAGVNPVNTDYRAEISTSASFTPLWGSFQGTDVFSHDFTGLGANTTYYARVWGVNHSGDLSQLPLDIGAVATAVRVPIMLDNFTTTPTGIIVRWDNNLNGPNTRYRLEDWGQLVNDNITTNSFNHTPLLVNSSHSYRALAYNVAGTPTVYSNEISTWTLASVPALSYVSNSPITIEWSLSAGANPTGQSGRADTEFAIQAFFVDPDGAPGPTHQNVYLRQDMGGGFFALNGTASDTDIWKTFSEWNNGVVISSGLATGRTYRFVAFARNGAGIRTIPSIPATGQTKSGVPFIYYNGPNGLIDGRQSFFGARVWTNTQNVPLFTRGAFNSNFEFLKDNPLGTIRANPVNQHINGSYPGWNGKIAAGFPLSNAVADPDGLGPLTIVDSTQPVSGFHTTMEGEWYLHVVGDPYAPDYGIFFHDSDPNQVHANDSPFRINVDMTAPLAPGGLQAYRQPADVPATPLPAGQQVGWDTPHFDWSDPDWNPADPTTISPTAGYSYLFTTNPSAVVPASTDTARNTDVDGYSEGFMAAVGPTDGHQVATLTAPNTYYFMVRSLDRAGNWGATRTYVYDVIPDNTPPTPVIDFGPSVRVAASGTTVAVSTTGVIRVYFNDDMYPSLVPSGFNLLLVRDNRDLPVGTPVPINVVYQEPPAVSTPMATITPSLGLSPGCLYRLTSNGNLQDDSGNVVTPPIDESFRTLMSPTVQNIVPSDLSVNPVSIVTFDPNTWGGGVLAGLAVNNDPMNQPMSAPSVSGQIVKANKGVNQNAKGYGTPLAVHEFNLYDAQALRLGGNFNRPVRMSMRYNDVDNNGYVDETEGTPYPVRVSALSLYWLDEDTGVWVRIPGSVVNTATRRVEADARHFSVYGLLGAPALDLASAYAYPVPYKPGFHQNGIRFNFLSSVGTIKIYTINGDLVKTMQFNDTNSNGSFTWNPVTNDAGEPLASDVYIYLIENQEQKKTGKLLVVR